MQGKLNSIFCPPFLSLGFVIIVFMSSGNQQEGKNVTYEPYFILITPISSSVEVKKKSSFFFLLLSSSLKRPAVE